MIAGIGTDIVQIARIEQSLARFGDAFAQRLLSEAECAIFRQQKHPAKYLAGRFAAKEAAAKALGTGFRDGLWFNHISVLNNSAGKPECQFHAKAHDLMQAKNIQHAHVSISHERDYAVAFVVLES